MEKFNEKRKQKIEEDLHTSEAMVSKDNKLKMGQKKFGQLKRGVDELWSQLENSYNVEHITNLENELKDKTAILDRIREERN